MCMLGGEGLREGRVKIECFYTGICLIDKDLLIEILCIDL